MALHLVLRLRLCFPQGLHKTLRRTQNYRLLKRTCAPELFVFDLETEKKIQLGCFKDVQ